MNVDLMKSSNATLYGLNNALNYWHRGSSEDIKLHYKFVRILENMESRKIQRVHFHFFISNNRTPSINNNK